LFLNTKIYIVKWQNEIERVQDKGGVGNEDWHEP